MKCFWNLLSKLVDLSEIEVELLLFLEEKSLNEKNKFMRPILRFLSTTWYKYCIVIRPLKGQLKFFIAKQLMPNEWDRIKSKSNERKI